MSTSEERQQRALAKRKELFGEGTRGRGVEDMAPEPFRLIEEFSFGGIWSRPGLETRSRSICVISALAVMGKEEQLRHHIRVGLRVGLTQQEIVEIMLQLVVYAGLPCAVQGLKAAKEVFAACESPAR